MHSSWNRNGGRVESCSMENPAKPDASYSPVSPAPFLCVCVCLSVWLWSAAPRRGQRHEMWGHRKQWRLELIGD